MNYIGSKHSLSSFIINEIEKRVPDLSTKVFAELFAGTGIISRNLKTKVKKVIANDMEFYSYVLIRNYIANHKKIEYKNLLDRLNNLAGTPGKIYNNYCSGSGSGRNYFSDYNGKKIDAIRAEIKSLYDNSEISEDQYYFFLASLLEASDKVANTASVYGAFLKHLKKSAQNNIILEPALFPVNKTKHEVYNEDANKLIKNISGDILYLDPPYNHRQYGANYHILNSIALYDNFKPKGKTGLRKYYKSPYCVKSKAAESFEDLIGSAKFKYIFLSYNNEGILSLSEIKKIMSKYGKYDFVVSENYQRFKADRDENRKYKATHTKEYLHVLERK